LNLGCVSFQLNISLASVCLVVVEVFSAPAVKLGNELQEVKSVTLPTLTVRAEASSLKSAWSVDVLSCDG
jgi:hypothetical protein